MRWPNTFFFYSQKLKFELLCTWLNSCDFTSKITKISQPITSPSYVDRQRQTVTLIHSHSLIHMKWTPSLFKTNHSSVSPSSRNSGDSPHRSPETQFHLGFPLPIPKFSCSELSNRSSHTQVFSSSNWWCVCVIEHEHCSQRDRGGYCTEYWD